MVHRLVIYNDEDHSFAYVIDLFVRTFGSNPKEAFALAKAIDDEGRGTFPVESLARARELEEKLLSGGPDLRTGRSDGSLMVSVEEVDGDKVKVLSCGRVGPHAYEPLEAKDVLARQRVSDERALRKPKAVTPSWTDVFVVLAIVFVAAFTAIATTVGLAALLGR